MRIYKKGNATHPKKGIKEVCSVHKITGMCHFADDTYIHKSKLKDLVIFDDKNIHKKNDRN